MRNRSEWPWWAIWGSYAEPPSIPAMFTAPSRHAGHQGYMKEWASEEAWSLIGNEASLKAATQ